MALKYLKNVKTLQELKKEYFRLAKILHPDHGGNLEEMKALNNEFDYLRKILPNEKHDAEDKKWHPESSNSMESYAIVLNELLRYPKITIEIIGSWLWVSGTGTFKIKDDILYKKFHFEYSKVQKKFYWFSGIENQKGYKFKGGLLKLAIQKYGIKTIQTEDEELKILPA